MTFESELELVLRLLVAGLCGYLIGYERTNRLKEAGTRTHLIVSLGSALIMIVSKYGFMDVLTLQGVSLDPSRIAAQVVSGIGFLGAGMIFVHKQSINGLTTAAGIWATAGIGMAIGANLYFIGISATIMIVLSQIVLHKDYPWNRLPVAENLKLTLSDNSSITTINQIFIDNSIEIINFEILKEKNNLVKLNFYLKIPKDLNVLQLVELLNTEKNIIKIEY